MPKQHGIIVSIMGKQWEFLFKKRIPKADGEPADGWTSDPEKPGRQIIVREGMDQKRELAVTLHEINHAGDWWKDEVFVQRLSDDQAEILYRLGWRKTEGD